MSCATVLVIPYSWIDPVLVELSVLEIHCITVSVSQTVDSSTSTGIVLVIVVSSINTVLVESVSWIDTVLVVTVFWIDPVLLESICCGTVRVIVVSSMDTVLLGSSCCDTVLVFTDSWSDTVLVESASWIQASTTVSICVLL